MTLPLRLGALPTVDTPNATMRRYRDPSGSAEPGALAVWRTEMAPGAQGPLHTVDRDHLVVVLAGGLAADIDGRRHELAPGDGILVAAGQLRQLSADAVEGAVTLTSATPGSLARVGDEEAVVVPWAG